MNFKTWFLMLTIACIMNEYQCQEKDKSVNRLNYGVHFKYHSRTTPTTGIWLHTVRIELPEEDVQNLVRVFSDAYLTNITRHNCVDKNDQIIRSFCVQFEPHSGKG